ncbi:MAG TPA: hypothetical protein VMW42_09485 [Desulfatiglandales bacterium]|nr:hypothetical protein [Desulfatiglandales bacterium]
MNTSIEWQPLEENLKNAAEMARGFAEEFGAGVCGYLAGLWHDLRYSEHDKVLCT